MLRALPDCGKQQKSARANPLVATNLMPDHNRAPNCADRSLLESKSSQRAAKPIRIARVDRWQPRVTQVHLPIRARDEECFLSTSPATSMRTSSCAIVPMAMDLVDNQFFSRGSRYLMCQHSHAYYNREAANAIAGPPTACANFYIDADRKSEDVIIYARPPKRIRSLKIPRKLRISER